MISQIKQVGGRVFDRILSDKNIDAFNGAQGRILYILWQGDGVPISKLSKETGLTVVIVSHDLPLVSRYCDRIVMIHDHKVFAVGTPEEVLTPENMRTVFNVDAELVKDDKTGMNTVAIHDSLNEL